MENYQGVAVVNYTDAETPYTRMIEHKHFSPVETRHTIITREYPEDWTEGREPYYPVNDKDNMHRYEQYRKRAEETCPRLIFWRAPRNLSLLQHGSGDRTSIGSCAGGARIAPLLHCIQLNCNLEQRCEQKKFWLYSRSSGNGIIVQGDDKWSRILTRCSQDHSV